MICDAARARTYKCHLVTVVVGRRASTSVRDERPERHDGMATTPIPFLDTFVVIKVRGVQGPS